MKVMIILPTLLAGGAERVVSILANEWAENNQVVLVLYSKNKVFYKLNEKVKVIELSFEVGNKSILSRLAQITFLSRDLRNTVLQEKPNFILSFMNKFNVFCLFSCLGLKNKIYVSERDGPSEKLSFLFQVIRNLSYKKSSGIICQTDASRKSIKKAVNHSNVIAIPNPISDFPNLVHAREPFILTVGRLVEKKGHKFLLNAFATIQDNSWRVVIAGDGPLKASLQNLCESLNISHRVDFIGVVEDVNDLYRRASLFVFPSLLEGFPNALAEAMACGLPVVSFDCDAGPSDLIEDGINGYLVPVGDSELLSQRMLYLIENRSLRENFGAKAHEIKDKLRADSISNQYFEFCAKDCDLYD